MKAIQVRYLPPTDRKPSRLKVSAEGVKSVTVQKAATMTFGLHDHRSSEDVAVQALLDQNPQWGWRLDDLVNGRLPNGDLVYVRRSVA
jgi:polysaccharide pyruvyl transferase WcaK-like protein